MADARRLLALPSPEMHELHANTLERDDNVGGGSGWQALGWLRLGQGFAETGDLTAALAALTEGCAAATAARNAWGEDMLSDLENASWRAVEEAHAELKTRVDAAKAAHEAASLAVVERQARQAAALAARQARQAVAGSALSGNSSTAGSGGAAPALNAASFGSRLEYERALAAQKATERAVRVPSST
eukprot:COSAG05_NODE_715_length_7805_cov_5.098235_10_plen_188_part_00